MEQTSNIQTVRVSIGTASASNNVKNPQPPLAEASGQMHRTTGDNEEQLGDVSISIRQRADDFLARGCINSYYRYRSALRAFERFNNAPVSSTDIGVQWLESCEDRFRFWGLSYTTINIYMKALKAVVSKSSPSLSTVFGRYGYRIPAPASRKIALSKTQIKDIAMFHGTAAQEKYRNLWLFSYLCNGINFKDMLFLRYNNVKDGEIVYVRSKTKGHAQRQINVALTPLMLKIMSETGNGASGSPHQFIFPFAKNDMTPLQVNTLVRKMVFLCNRELCIIAKKLGIPKFTTYSARHSYATVLCREGVDIAYISETLGHSSLEMTRTYLTGFGHNERVINSAKLL